MIIKHPENKNIPALTCLWGEAFGDSEDFVRGFFRTGYAPERSLLAEEAGEVLGALYWFDCLWEGKKIAYLYAIATGKAHRGKGVCRELMSKTHEVLTQRGYSGSLLVPADAGLARMYEKSGYRPMAQPTKTRWEIPTAFEEISPEAYLRLREDLLPRGGVQHTLPALRYFATFGRFYRTPEGIFCGTPEAPAEHLPSSTGANAMYLSLDDEFMLPTWFALPLA